MPVSVFSDNPIEMLSDPLPPAYGLYLMTWQKLQRHKKNT